MIFVGPVQLRTFCDFRNNYLIFVVACARRRVTLGQLEQIFLFSCLVSGDAKCSHCRLCVVFRLLLYGKLDFLISFLHW